MRWLSPLLLLAATLLVALGTYWASFGYFRAEELEKATERLSLYRSTVVAELERFSHLTFVLARDTAVIETARGGETEALNARLKAFADRAGIDAIYLMDREGLTRAASNAGTPDSFVGQNYSFRPYFRTALAGRQGAFYGIGATTGIPGYFYADAVSDADGTVLGVIAIKIDLSPLQDSWQQAGERVILANADGVTLLASNPDWRYRSLAPLDADQRDRIAAARQFMGQSLAPLDWTRADANAARLGEETLIHLTSDALPNGWSLHYFAPTEQAAARSTLAAGATVLLAGLAIIVLQIRRTRLIGAALARSEREEAQLRAANERLAVEIDERRTAERRLQRTKRELERAGRLAALGQLAASVTHELGQPIAAMRNHLAATEIQSGATPLTERLQGLVDRMEGITRQLKFFARKGRDDVEPVDLREALTAVLDLVAPNIAQGDVRLSVDRGEGPAVVLGNRLRVEQVMTNLLRNALDAVEGTAAPAVEVGVRVGDEGIVFEVCDNGHGLGDYSLDDLSEPFRTTRESGKGMGLGLAISAGIMEDHDGRLTAGDRPGGGAVFRAVFPGPVQEVAAQ